MCKYYANKCNGLCVILVSWNSLIKVDQSHEFHMSAYYGRRFYVVVKVVTMYERLRRELKDAYAFTDELIDGIINYISTNPNAYDRIVERLKEEVERD